MKGFSTAVSLAALLALGACAAPGNKAATGAAAPVQTARNDGVVCTMEKPVGSHLPQRVCMTTTQREALRAQSQEGLGPRGGADRMGKVGN